MPRARHYDPDQPVVREGEVEYITLRSGRRHEVRRWKTGSHEWHPELPRVYRNKKSCLRDNFLVSVRDENLVSANGSKMLRETIFRKLVSADVLQHFDVLASGPEQGPEAPRCCQKSVAWRNDAAHCNPGGLQKIYHNVSSKAFHCVVLCHVQLEVTYVSPGGLELAT